MTNTTPENPLAESANKTRKNIVGLGPEIAPNSVLDINSTRRRIKQSQDQDREDKRQQAVNEEITAFSELAVDFVIQAFDESLKVEDHEKRTVLRSAISNVIQSGDQLLGAEGNPQDVFYVDSLVDQLYPREDGFGGLESEEERRARIGREVVRPAIFGEIALDDEFLDHQALAA